MPIRTARGAQRQTLAPWLLRAVAVTMFVFPANMVFKPLGANGYVAMVLALVLTMTWAASVLWGLHDPINGRHPARIGLALLWLATVASFIAMGGGPATVEGKSSADRWVIALLAFSGIVMVIGETVHTREQVVSLIRALVWGATFCAAVGLYQFVFRSDPVHFWTDLMAGMADNGGRTTFQLRSQFVRVAGTTFSPIELGVVMVMVAPLAIWRCIYDVPRHRWIPVVQFLAILGAAVCTVSRSMFLSLVVVAAVVIPFLPLNARRWSYVLVPAGLVSVFAFVPGMVATMAGTFAASSDDPSITTRLNNYPRVEAMVADRPLLGTGPGTYLPANALKILDNQYLKAAVEMGLLGAVALTLFFAFPAIAALLAARALEDPEMKTLAGGISGSCFAALVVSSTFDSMSFPTFALIFAYFAGLSGSVWILAREHLDGNENSPLLQTDVINTSRREIIS